MSSIQLKIIGVTAATLLIATAIYVSVSYQPQGSLEVDYPTYTVSNFGSYDDFNTFLQASVEAQTNNALSDGSETPSASRTDASNEENKGSDVASDTEYDASDSGTQSSAVEEADIVKSDGTYLYVISQGSLCIISAYPAEDAELVSTITFEESSTPRNLFINGDNLAVITQSYLYRTLDEKEPSDDVECIWQDTTSTHIILYDISDRENPVKIRDVSLEGYYYTAHMIDEYVYVITTQYTYEPVLYEGAESSYVPKICIDEDVKTIGLSSIYYINDPGISKTLTHIVSVHIKDVSKEVHAEVFLVGDPSVIYVSSDSVYIASSSYLNDYETIQGLLEEYVLPALPSEASHEIDAVDSLTLEEYQKTMVIEWVIQNYVEQMDEQQRQTIAEELITQLQKTLLHKITLDNGDITYADQGTIPGTINNQDALSEYNGYLYVVTTMNGWVMSSYLSSIESYNNLYVLDETLDVVGSLDHLSNGASVSSV
ncbi:MAG: beta-propeller domain-containing protein, partial [Candidatus Thermoplasmatota archaeon]|nr:beta-propeller domain-containing protein [Candidatus Thermoplasmatota archaeon]